MGHWSSSGCSLMMNVPDQSILSSSREAGSKGENQPSVPGSAEEAKESDSLRTLRKESDPFQIMLCILNSVVNCNGGKALVARHRSSNFLDHHSSVGTGSNLESTAGFAKWTLGKSVSDSRHGRSFSFNFGVASSTELVTATEDLLIQIIFITLGLLITNTNHSAYNRVK